MSGHARFTFDIETGPSEEIAKYIAPYPTFDPASVKVGNLKDEEKIAEKIQNAEKLHNQGREPYYDSETKKLLTKSYASRVEAIGINITDLNNKTENYILSGDESHILSTFWGMLTQFNGMFLDRVICGWNIKEFDFPFIVQRSWRYRTKIHWNSFCNKTPFRGNKIYYNDFICDLMHIFACGSFTNKWTSLDNASKSVLGHGKPDGMTGDMYWKLSRSTDLMEREQAKQYLKTDLNLVDEMSTILLG